MFQYTEEKYFTQGTKHSSCFYRYIGFSEITGTVALYKALMNSSTVLTVWDGEKLVGLTRVLDDTEMLAQIHYVLVHPDYQGQGIAGKMINLLKENTRTFSISKKCRRIRTTYRS